MLTLTITRHWNRDVSTNSIRDAHQPNRKEEIRWTILRHLLSDYSVSQSVITCSKLTTETLEQGVKYV